MFGAGRAVLKAEMEAYARQGALDPDVLEPVHFHNDALQGAGFRRGAGLAGLAGDPAGGAQLLAFSLTEVIFWSVKGSLFYALMVVVLMGLCLNAQSGGYRAHCARMLP